MIRFHSHLSIRELRAGGQAFDLAIYSYNADDTTHVVTDARLVTTTYGYNNRHQVTSLTYNVNGDPTGLTAYTTNVSFGYDAAGNRISMSDGLGSGAYNFNNLGQMDSET